MYQSFYRGMSLAHLPLFALLLFFGIFLGVAAWLFLARRAQDYDALARLPLAEPGALPRGSNGMEASHE